MFWNCRDCFEVSKCVNQVRMMREDVLGERCDHRHVHRRRGGGNEDTVCDEQILTKNPSKRHARKQWCSISPLWMGHNPENGPHFGRK